MLYIRVEYSTVLYSKVDSCQRFFVVLVPQYSTVASILPMQILLS